MINLFKALILLTFFSCDTTVEEYLYDSNDPEYVWAQNLALQECIEDASIFDYLDTAGDFENLGILNDIYKISQDDNNATNLYVQIKAVSSSAMTIVVNSSESGYRKIINYTKTNHDTILTELKTMACSTLYDNVSASGLGNTDTLTLNWFRESIGKEDDEDDSDDTPELYDRETNVYTFSKEYPLLFYYWNAQKQSNRVITEGEEEVEKKSIITITDVTDTEDCDQDSSESEYPIDACDFNDVSTFATCDVVINSGVYSTSEYGKNLISLTSTNSGTCSLLQSANVTIQN